MTQVQEFALRAAKTYRQIEPDHEPPHCTFFVEARRMGLTAVVAGHTEDSWAEKGGAEFEAGKVTEEIQVVLRSGKRKIGELTFVWRDLRRIEVRR